MMKKMAYKVVLLLLVLLAAGVTVYLVLVLYNNRDTGMPDRDEYAAAFERSVQWLHLHRSKLLRDNNPMLWWMVKESAELSSDSRLLDLFAEYRKIVLDPNPRNLWGGLFSASHYIRVDMDSIRHLPDYNQHFIYG